MYNTTTVTPHNLQVCTNIPRQFEVTNKLLLVLCMLKLYYYIIRDQPRGSEPRSHVPPVPNLYIDHCVYTNIIVHHCCFYDIIIYPQAIPLLPSLTSAECMHFSAFIKACNVFGQHPASDK